MSTSPVAIVRLAAPGAPSLRKVAARVGVSPAMISKFELGEAQLTAERLEKYAKAVHSTERELLRRFHEAKVMLYERKLRDARQRLRRFSSTGRRRGPSIKAQG